MKTPKAKLMIIAWKWLNISVPPEQKILESGYDELPIKDQPTDLLIRIDNRNNRIQDFFKHLETKVIPKYKATHFIQLFLHTRDGFDYEEHFDYATQILSHDDIQFGSVHFFGNGAEHLYIRDPDSPYGLLGNDGKLSGIFKGQYIYAFEVDSSKKIQIKSSHFNKTWEFYYYQLYRKTFELKQWLNRFYLPLLEPGLEKDFASFPGSIKILDYINEYIILTAGKKDKLGFTFPTLNERGGIILAILRENLKTLLLSSPPTRSQLLHINQLFCDLLNELPEKTYA